MIGVQAAGKSSFYKDRLFGTHVRIALDMLKTRERERAMVEACLAARQSLAVDNTNVLRADRARYIAAAKKAGFRVVGYYFPCTLAAALERNRGRSGAARIPPAGIAATLRRLEPPSPAEGFDALSVVEIPEAAPAAVE